MAEDMSQTREHLVYGTSDRKDYRPSRLAAFLYRLAYRVEQRKADRHCRRRGHCPGCVPHGYFCCTCGKHIGEVRP